MFTSRTRNLSLAAVLAVSFACNFPGPSTEPAPAASPVPQAGSGATASEGAAPAGEPVVNLQPGSGYLFASGQVVVGADDRDVWWNGATLVPGRLVASLGPVADLSTVDQISASAIVERELPPIVGEAYAMQAVDGQYVLVRVLSFGAEREINLEWLYPFAGQVLP